MALIFKNYNSVHDIILPLLIKIIKPKTAIDLQFNFRIIESLELKYEKTHYNIYP